MSDDWYSDAALAKQAEAAQLQASGERVSLTLLSGIMQSRVSPQPHERCVNCRGDARDQAGGVLVHERRFCDLCWGRGRDEDWQDYEPSGPKP